MIDLRDERPGDAYAIHGLHRLAFDGSEMESRIVNVARQRGQVVYSIVAEEAGKLLGHVLVTPMVLEPPAPLRLVAIGPIGVLPAHQSAGIGSRLMREVVDRASEDGYDAIFLLGDPGYYRRFDFTTAPVGNEYGAEDAFMVLQLKRGCLNKVGSTHIAKYISAFADAEMR